jgi:hypothetical protein
VFHRQVHLVFAAVERCHSHCSEVLNAFCQLVYAGASHVALDFLSGESTLAISKETNQETRHNEERQV